MGVKEDNATLLRKKGFRATPGKLRILSALQESQEPTSIAELSKKLKKKVDVVTVYRALESLVNAGLVRRVDLHHPHAHYEYVDETEHHHHLVCRLCGKVEDVESCDPMHLEGRVLRKSKEFASIETHAMEFFGVCKDCIKKS